jgi:hypothetical protein
MFTEFDSEPAQQTSDAVLHKKDTKPTGVGINSSSETSIHVLHDRPTNGSQAEPNDL